MMKYCFLLFVSLRAFALSYTPADVEFIAKSNDTIGYILTVEARELQMAESSQALLEDLSSFYKDLQAAGAKGQQIKFLDRRKAALLRVAEWAKAEKPRLELESQLLAISGSRFEVFKEKSQEQSLAIIIHLYARNRAIVFKEANADIAYLAGRAAFHSALLGSEYLKRFLDLSDVKDKRRASAQEMLKLIEAIKQ